MGWAYGTNQEGRQVGYGVKGTCDLDGCDAKIDRGLGYVCGSMHDGGEYGCGRYFCAEHLFYCAVRHDLEKKRDDPFPQLCGACCVQFEASGDASDD